MKSLLYLFSLILAFQLQGQIKPDIFPEDLHAEEMQIRCFCKPGVINKSRSKGLSISYGRIGDGAYKKERNTLFSDPLSKYETLQNLQFKIKAPIILKDNFTMLLGYKHYTEFFDFEQIGTDFSFAFQGLDDARLKSNALSLSVFKPLNETRYLIFRFRYSADGNYDNWMSFNKKYAIYNFFSLYAFKPDESFEWGIGVGGARSFRRSGVLPFLLVNKTFNQRWGIEAVLPIFAYGRYNINKKNILLFGFQYDSQSYRLDINNNNLTNFAYAYNHSELISSVRLEHRIAPWVWANLRIGYQNNYSSDFESKNDASPLFYADPTNALFLNIGIFISPPDDFKK